VAGAGFSQSTSIFPCKYYLIAALSYFCLDTTLSEREVGQAREYSKQCSYGIGEGGGGG
jgi:hypothetical protein